jgi:WD40 repeat protein
MDQGDRCGMWVTRMRRLWPAAIVLAFAVACSTGGNHSRPKAKEPTPPPKNFRVTLLSEPIQVAHGVALSSDGKRALISSAEETTDPPHGSVSLWDLSDPLHPRHSTFIPDRGGIAPAVALSGDGKHAATFNPVGKVTLWDLSDPAKPTSRPFPWERVRSLAFDNDAGSAISAGDNGVYFWDLSDPGHPRKTQLLAESKEENLFYDVAMSADGKRALVNVQSGGGSGDVTVWDLSNPSAPEEYALLRNENYYGATTVALSGDGNHALVSYHRSIDYTNLLSYWDLRTWDKSELRPMVGRKVIPDTGGSTLQWETALDYHGERVLIAQENEPDGMTESKRSVAEVRFWALDTLDRFPPFRLYR